jgi:hypothetical protein
MLIAFDRLVVVSDHSEEITTPAWQNNTHFGP